MTDSSLKKLYFLDIASSSSPGPCNSLKPLDFHIPLDVCNFYPFRAFSDDFSRKLVFFGKFQFCPPCRNFASFSSLLSIDNLSWYLHWSLHDVKKCKDKYYLLFCLDCKETALLAIVYCWATKTVTRGERLMRINYDSIFQVRGDQQDEKNFRKIT